MVLCGLTDFAFNSLPYSSIGMPDEWQGGEGSEVKRAQFSDHRHGLEWTLTERSTAELADAILGKGCVCLVCEVSCILRHIESGSENSALSSQRPHGPSRGGG